MPNESFAIRSVTVEDTATLCRIIQQSYKDVAQRFGLTIENCPKHPSNYTEQWVEKDMCAGVIYFLLEASGRSAGCAALEVVDEAQCYLERLAVLPKARRKGYGRKLVEHIIGEAKARGLKKAGIGITAQQHELMQWYQKIGFEKGDIKTFDHLPFNVRFMSFTIE